MTEKELSTTVQYNDEHNISLMSSKMLFVVCHVAASAALAAVAHLQTAAQQAESNSTFTTDGAGLQATRQLQHTKGRAIEL
jgi:hypothetical protein